jgi:hypothetical protein
MRSRWSLRVLIGVRPRVFKKRLRRNLPQAQIPAAAAAIATAAKIPSDQEPPAVR